MHSPAPSDDRLDVITYVRETNILDITRHIRQGEKIGVLGISPLFPPLRPLLEMWVSRQKARGHLVDIFESRPDLVCLGRYTHFMRAYEHFPTTEPWIEDYFDFQEAEKTFGVYARAYKHVVCNFCNRIPFVAHTLETIWEKYPSQIIFGIPLELLSVYRFRIGEPKGGLAQVGVHLNWAVNIILAAVAVSYLSVWVLSRTRLLAPKPETIFMAFDFSCDIRREELLWKELADAPEPNLIIFRNKEHRRLHEKALKNWRTSDLGAGRYGPWQAITALGLGIQDTILLAWRGRFLTTGVFWNLVKLPYQRIMNRGFFNRFRCKNFWAKDEYSASHIMRTFELHRVGGQHLGRLHGLPTSPLRFAEYAYIDLDIYYTFGEDYGRHYTCSWPDTMKVEPAGSYCLNREQLHKLGEPREKNILIFLSDTFQTEQVIKSSVEIARAFPDRLVYIKTRPDDYGGHGVLFPTALKEAPENLVRYQGHAEDLLPLGRYVLSEPSTLVVEALQFGHFSFALVMDNRFRGLEFEKYPGLCLHSVDEIVVRIKAIETGDWAYPRESYKGLVNLSGKIVWDVVRKNIGLPPIDDDFLPALKFVETD